MFLSLETGGSRSRWADSPPGEGRFLLLTGPLLCIMAREKEHTGLHRPL